MSRLPDYLPEKAPAQTVTDLSGTLSQAQLARLDSAGKSLNYKARVVILPKTYKAEDADQLRDLTADVATAWKVEDNRFLLVVDLSGRKLHAIAGHDLTSQGVTNVYLQRTVWPTYFYPYVRQGDVEGALSNTLNAVQARELAYTRPAQGSGSGTTTGSLGAGHGSYSSTPMAVPTAPNFSGNQTGPTSWILIGSLTVVAAAGIFFVTNNTNKDKNKRLSKALTERLGKLYATADELGQASEYIAPQSNKELALKVSAFFEKLQALDKAKDEIDRLTASKRWGKANEALTPALRLADKLNNEAEALFENVSAITGGVDSLKLEKKDKTALAINTSGDMSESDPGDKIKINMPTPYQRPAWTYEQEYNQPIFANGGGGGIFDMLFLLNQMDTNRRLDNLENNQWQSNQGAGLFSNTSYQPNYERNSVGSSNFGSDNFGGAGSGGGDSSGSGFSTDSGGAWGGSSDSGFSTDTGGDWGGSSNSGSDSGSSSGSDSGSSSGSDSGSSAGSGGDW